MSQVDGNIFVVRAMLEDEMVVLNQAKDESLA